MSRRSVKGLRGFAAIGTLGVLMAWIPGSPSTESSETEVTLVAEGFVWNGDNPTLRFSKGSPVSVIVRNDEGPGVYHTLKFAGFGAASAEMLAPGESDTLRFTPDADGIFSYTCSLHPGQMTGEVVVE